jgi:hypothetical protein
MSAFRVTKYNPEFRLLDGSFGPEEWTSVADVGKVFCGRTFTLSDYLVAEDAYVEAVRLFLAESGERCLRVAGLESYGSNCELLPRALVEETKKHSSSVKDAQNVRGEDLEWIVRLVLRDAIWCRLEGATGFYVHFGYDYYMYVGSDALGSVAPTMPPGVFAEVFESPHHPEPSDETEG